MKAVAQKEDTQHTKEDWESSYTKKRKLVLRGVIYTGIRDRQLIVMETC